MWGDGRGGDLFGFVRASFVIEFMLMIRVHESMLVSLHLSFGDLYGKMN